MTACERERGKERERAFYGIIEEESERDDPRLKTGQDKLTETPP